MLYFISPGANPLRHISCGQLINNGGFIHPRRTIDTFVLILGSKGVLHIEQNGTRHQIGADEYILLFPGMMHVGSKMSDGYLSYYWCHFQVPGNDYRLIDDEAVSRQLHLIKENSINTNDCYIIPEAGNALTRSMPKHSERSVMLFRQLLDMAERKVSSEYMANYALSLLAMDISADFISGYNVGEVSPTYKQIVDIMEWIRINYAASPDVATIAKTFSFNPNYLSNAFKKHTGCSLVDYINRMKVTAAKKALLSSSDTVKAIALACGFKDEKYFMKVFKKQEGVTPGQYRNAFYRKHMNL